MNENIFKATQVVQCKKYFEMIVCTWMENMCRINFVGMK